MALARGLSVVLMLAFMSTSFIILPGDSESVGWSEPFAIGDGIGEQAETPQSAANDMGHIIVAWSEWQADWSGRVMANRFAPAQGWSGPEVLAENSDIVGYTAVGIDDAGNCIVVWAQGPSIQSRTYTADVGWEPTVEVSSSTTSRWFYDVKMAEAPDGSAMVIWCEDSMDAYAPYRAAYRPAGGAWQSPSAFQTTSNDIENVRLANDGAGNFLVAFTLYDGTRFGIYANIYAPSTGWGNEVRIENESYNVYDLNVAMNRNGYAVAVWQQFGYPDWNSPTAFANTYSPESGWATAGPMEELGSGGTDTPVVSMDEYGNAVAIWRRVANDLMSSSLRTNTYTAGTGWGTPATLEYSADSIDAHISVGAAGDETFAAWIQVTFTENSSEGFVLELVTNHYNSTSGWETPFVLTTDIASSPSLTADNLGGAVMAWFGNATAPNVFVSHFLASEPPPDEDIEATVDIKPDTLNPKSMGKYLTVYIELPEGYDVRDIVLDSVKLNSEVPALATHEVGDYDKDKIDDLMVKFELSSVPDLMTAASGETIAMSVSGELLDGTSFAGWDEVHLASSNVKTMLSILSLASAGGLAGVAAVLSTISGAAVSAACLIMARSGRCERISPSPAKV